MSKILSNNFEGNISSSLINLCHYISEYDEDEFVPAASNLGLTFLGQYLLLKLQV